MKNEIKTYEQLLLTDDFLFAKVMSNKELCKELLEIILNVKITDIVYLEKQKAIDISADGKSVRLDVYVADESHTIYDVEMQVKNRHNLPKRSRFYQSMIDMEWLEKGEDYNELKQSYIIFICTFDPFGMGRHIYTFKNCCEEQKDLALQDGTTKIFLNANGTMDDVSEELHAFLNYLIGEKSADEFVEKVDEAVIRARKNMEWRREYMTLELKYREILEDGREEGREEGIKSLVKTCRELGVSDEYILNKLMKDFELTGKQAEKYLEEYSKLD